MTKETKRLNTL